MFTGLVENLTLCVNDVKRSFGNISFPLLKFAKLMIFKNVNFSIIFIWEKKRFIFCTFSVGWVETSEPDITSFWVRLWVLKYWLSVPRLISLDPRSVLFIVVSNHAFQRSRFHQALTLCLFGVRSQPRCLKLSTPRVLSIAQVKSRVARL